MPALRRDDSSCSAQALLVAAALVTLIVGTLVPTQPALAGPAALPSPDDLQISLRTFCEVRMSELKRQGQAHLAAVKWQQEMTAVRGQYVDYSPDYVCAVSPSSGDTPVGRMRYQKIHFEKRGADVGAAMEAAPEAMRIEEVTQVFIYRRGVWE